MLLTTYYTLNTTHYTLHTTHYTLKTTQYTLHTIQQLIFLVNSAVLTSVFIPFSDPSYASSTPLSEWLLKLEPSR